MCKVSNSSFVNEKCPIFDTRYELVQLESIGLEKRKVDSSFTYLDIMYCYVVSVQVLIDPECSVCCY